MKVIVLYCPVPHSGYKRFFKRHSADIIFVLDDSITSEFNHLRKNISALTSNEVQVMLQSLDWTSSAVKIAGADALSILNSPGTNIVMPNEDVSQAVAKKYLNKCTVVFDSVFLRWDMSASTKNSDVTPDTIISVDEFDVQLMNFLESEKEKSSDFWRQVAGAIVRDAEIVCFAYNKHVPDWESPYIYGDPRMHFSRGVEIDVGTGEHVERQLISLCAKNGWETNGTSLYVTTFPCPPCAKAVATAGFTKCYFRQGYGRLDAELVLKSAGIEIIQVK